MEGFTLVDAGVAVVIVVSAILAYARGFVREALAIAGWVAAAVLAYMFAPRAEPLMREIPVVGDFLAKNCVISMIAAFSLILALGLLILAVFTPIFSSVVLDSILGPVDRVLGFLFGVARGVLLIAVAYLIYTNLSGADMLPALANAASKPMLDQAAGVLDQYRPKEVPPWFNERIEALMSPCGDAAPTPTPPPTPTDGSSNT